MADIDTTPTTTPVSVSVPDAEDESVATQPQKAAMSVSASARAASPARKPQRTSLAELEANARYRMTKWRADIGVMAASYYPHVRVDLDKLKIYDSTPDGWSECTVHLVLPPLPAQPPRPFARSVAMLELQAAESSAPEVCALAFPHPAMALCGTSLLPFPVTYVLPGGAGYTRLGAPVWRSEPYQGLDREALLTEYIYGKYEDASDLLSEVDFNGDGDAALITGGEKGSALLYSAFRRRAAEINDVDKASLKLKTRREIAALAHRDAADILGQRRKPRLYANDLNFRLLVRRAPSSAASASSSIQLWFGVVFHEIQITQYNGTQAAPQRK